MSTQLLQDFVLYANVLAVIFSREHVKYMFYNKIAECIMQITIVQILTWMSRL